jgi:exonuclease III
MFWNVTGLNDRLRPELTQYLHSREISVAAIAETHLAPGISPPFIFGYTGFSLPHSTRSSGVAIYVAKPLTSSQLPNLSVSLPFSTTAAQLISVLVTDPQSPDLPPVLVIVSYAPPNTPLSYLQQLVTRITEARSLSIANDWKLILLGDLNTYHSSLGNAGALSHRQSVARSLSQSLHSANLLFANGAATFVPSNRHHTPHTIDLCLFTPIDAVVNMSVVSSDDPYLGPLVPRHQHRLLLVTSPFIPLPSRAQTRLYSRGLAPARPKPPLLAQFYETVESILKSKLAHDRPPHVSTTDSLAENLTEVITHAATQTFPVKARSRPDVSKITMTEDLRLSINRRKKLIAKMAKLRLNGLAIPPELRARKCAADRARNKALSVSKQIMWERKCSRITFLKETPNASVSCNWKAFNKTLTKGLSAQPVALSPPNDPRSILPPQDSLNAFAALYAKVFEIPGHALTNTNRVAAYCAVTDYELRGIHRPEELEDATCSAPFSTQELRAALRIIPRNKAPGADRVPNVLIKYAGPKYESTILQLMNSSLTEGVIPRTWKLTKCVALFKGGATTDFTNYRLIALSATMLKLAETLVLARVKATAPPVNLHPLQFGFRAAHSTGDALYFVHQKIVSKLEKGNTAFAAFLDIKKAFDTVDTTILRAKLLERGVRGRIWSWISAYLTGRRFYVSSGQLRSKDCSAPNGTPQGGVLSPYLFLLYIDDLGTLINNCGCDAVFFADDLVILPRSHDLLTAINQLQNALNAVTEWAKDNLLVFNTKREKSAVLRWCPPALRNTPYPSLTLCGQPLHFESEYKYLGVWFDSDLLFLKHHEQVVKRTAMAAAYIRRVISEGAAIPPKIVRTLVQAFVFPQFLYAAHITRSPLPLTSACKLKSAVASVLARALHLKQRSPHHLSLFKEFDLPTPAIAIAQAVIGACNRLSRGATPATPVFATSVVGNIRTNTAAGKMHLFTEQITVGQNTDMAATVERLWLACKWGQPLKAASTTSPLPPNNRLPNYLALPSPSSVVRGTKIRHVLKMETLKNEESQ